MVGIDPESGCKLRLDIIDKKSMLTDNIPPTPSAAWKVLIEPTADI
jgi:hypothetical protein